MSNYFWAAAKPRSRPTPALPPPPDAPKLSLSIEKSFVPGQPLVVRIHNYGGPAKDWELSGAPGNVAITERSPNYAALEGTISTFLPPPDVQEVTQQNITAGQPVTLQITNTGGRAIDWSAVNLPAGLSIIEETETYCIISGTAS